MANYQKYMFDDFVVNDDKAMDVSDNKEDIADDEFLDTLTTEENKSEVEHIENIEEIDLQTEFSVPEETPADITNEADTDFQTYDYIKELEVKEDIVTYSEEELREALEQAEAVAYNRGLEEAKGLLIEKQNILLEEIKNQLITIFASLEAKKTDIEISALNFAISVVRKVLPTLEQEQAEKEVKNFLANNFSGFASQEVLSFSFNPDIISQVADSISRLAEQNDFEGKISIHKDMSLGASDCRVEWKSGGVEKKASNILNKVESLINVNKQERENGE